jgi:hypothetical protein
MVRSSGLLALILLTAGCGGGVNSTSATGTVGGSSLSAPHAVYKENGDTLLVLISDDTNACNDLSPVNLLGRSGVFDVNAGVRRPSLFLKVNTEHWYSANDRTVGVNMDAFFDPGDPSAASAFCPGDLDGGVPASADGGFAPCATVHDIKATAGSGKVEEVDSRNDPNPVAEGTFDLSFPSGRMSGGYHATPCDGLATGCSSAGGAALLPLLLSAATLRRRTRPRPSPSRRSAAAS